MKYRRIAVTTDFSAASLNAFPAAVSLARKFGAELHLVHWAQIPPVVISPWPEVGPYPLQDDVIGDSEKRLTELIRGEKAFASLDVRPRVVEGESAHALGDFLEAEKIDLVVASSHGHSALKRLLLGSFVERILRLSPCPVLVLRGAGAPAAAEFQAARILVPHDFSSASRASLAVARDWARAFGAMARLFFVVEHGAGLYDYASKMEGSFQEYLEKVRLQALDRFRNLLREEWKGINAEAGAAQGDVAAEVLREAESHSAALIVIGAHSRSGIERFFVGSVTQKVVRQAPCPVLVVRGA